VSRSQPQVSAHVVGIGQGGEGGCTRPGLQANLEPRTALRIGSEHQVIANRLRAVEAMGSDRRRHGPGWLSGAQIEVLAADGVGTNEIVRRTGASKQTIIAWKCRYAVEGLGGMPDADSVREPRPRDASFCTQQSSTRSIVPCLASMTCRNLVLRAPSHH
jgi:hypothetical protein